jgi:hypothetical protein
MNCVKTYSSDVVVVLSITSPSYKSFQKVGENNATCYRNQFGVCTRRGGYQGHLKKVLIWLLVSLGDELMVGGHIRGI